MSDSVTVGQIPDCDICKSVGKLGIPAYVDGKTTFGPWANMCREHFNLNGVGLGTGKGQVLVLRTEPEKSQDERIKDNLKGIDLNTLSFEDFEDLFEDRDPMEFM